MGRFPSFLLWPWRRASHRHRALSVPQLCPLAGSCTSLCSGPSSAKRQVTLVCPPTLWHTCQAPLLAGWRASTEPCGAQPAPLLAHGDGGSGRAVGTGYPAHPGASCTAGALLRRWKCCQGSKGCPARPLPAGTARGALTPASLSAPSVPAKGTEVHAFWDCCWSGLSAAAPAQRPGHSVPLHPAKRQLLQEKGDANLTQLRSARSSRSSKPSAGHVAARGAGVLWETTHSPGSSAEQMAEQTAPGFLFHILFCPTHSHV